MKWAKVRLESIKSPTRYSFVGGPFGSELTTRDYVSDGVPVIRGNNLSGISKFNDDDFVCVSEEKAAALQSNLAYPGDLIFTQRGTLGQVGLIPKDAKVDRYVVSQSQMKLTVDEAKAEPLFLYYYFRLAATTQRILNSVSTSGVPHINLSILKAFEIELPPKPVQESIVEIAGAYDDLIDNNRRRITALEEAARLLYREWFVHFRFPGHEHVKVVDGLPEGWLARTIGDVADTNAESYRAKELPEAINYIDISSVERGRIVSKTLIPSSDAPGRARRKARDGDVIWSNVRPNLRAYALILDPEENDVFSTGFTVLSAREVPFTWLYMSVTTESFVGHLVNHATGVGYPAVRPDDFERAPVRVPPSGVLKLFHQAVEPNFRLVLKLVQQNQKLGEARDILLPRLMDGEIAI